MAHLREKGRVILATSASQQEKWDVRLTHNPVHDNAYYSKCALGGVLSCGLTHTAVTPLDVAKCNMQFDPSKYKGLFGEDMRGSFTSSLSCFVPFDVGCGAHLA